MLRAIVTPLAASFIEVEVESLAPGGDAFGRQVGGTGDGRATFVALAAPGERVKARVLREKRDVAFAQLVEVLRASAHRVVPPCPLFGTCGGCQWQHVDTAAQQAAKLAIVKRALRTDAVTLRTPGPAFGYRDRAKFTSVRRGPQRLLGFKRSQSHDVVDVPQCPLLSPAAAAGLAALREAELPEGDVFLQVGAAERIGLKTPADSFILEGSQRISQKTINLGGAEEPRLEIAIGGFAQVGSWANRELVNAVLTQVGEAPGAVLELYAGGGNFTRFVAPRSAQFLASDGDPVARALGAQNVPSVRWLPPEEVPLTEVFDTVLVDPPRAGLDPLGFDLARMANKSLVYVSCDPQTLGRDARRLQECGFALAHVEALDLMPQTHHVEVVARFVR